MKTKNFVMAVAAFVFAISASFASMFADQDVYVFGVKQDGDTPTCLRTTAACDNTGLNICQVQIHQTSNNSNVVASTTGTRKTYIGTTCANTLKDTGGEVQIANVVGFPNGIFELTQ